MLGEKGNAMKCTLRVVCCCTALLHAQAAIAQTSPAAPIEISTLEQLQKIGQTPEYPQSGHYILTADIDASQTLHWNGGKGFMPIAGEYIPPKPAKSPPTINILRPVSIDPPRMAPSVWFTGTFDGTGHALRGLYINRSDRPFGGLFGGIGKGAIIRNLNIQDAHIIGGWQVGVLAGQITDARVENCSIEGTAQGKETVGLFAGETDRAIAVNCHAKGRIEYELRAGGLVGFMNEGALEDCSSTSVTFANTHQNPRELDDMAATGGLIGYAFTNVKITKCTDLVNIQVPGTAGGILGKSYDGVKLMDCTASGKVNAYHAGGLAGALRGIVRRCRFSGEVIANSGAGGLIGSLAGGQVEDSESSATVRTIGERAGGLLGSSGGRVANCSARGVVEGRDCVGGFVGENFGSLNSATMGLIANCAAFARVKASGESAGGFAGRNSGTLAGCSATGDVFGREACGGLVGEAQDSLLADCQASCNVWAEKEKAGGLVGWMVFLRRTMEILRCQATGSVSANRFIGGLCGGGGLSRIADCLTSTTVTARENNPAGGLLGSLDNGKIERCLALGRIQSLQTNNRLGGLIGCVGDGFSGGRFVRGKKMPQIYNIVNSFWNIETTGQTEGFGEIRQLKYIVVSREKDVNPQDMEKGLRAEELKRKDTYRNWDFQNIWTIEDGKGYPVLRSSSGVFQRPPQGER